MAVLPRLPGQEWRQAPWCQPCRVANHQQNREGGHSAQAMVAVHLHQLDVPFECLGGQRHHGKESRQLPRQNCSRHVAGLVGFPACQSSASQSVPLRKQPPISGHHHPLSSVLVAEAPRAAAAMRPLLPLGYHQKPHPANCWLSEKSQVLAAGGKAWGQPIQNPAEVLGLKLARLR